MLRGFGRRKLSPPPKTFLRTLEVVAVWTVISVIMDYIDLSRCFVERENAESVRVWAVATGNQDAVG